MSERPLTYNEYLGLSSLLDLQRTQSDPPDRDEVLFIVVHQVYELWFKQSLLEIQAVIDSLLEGEALVAMKALKRIHAIFRVILSQIDVLETMTPVDFLNFRNLLGSSSGFQSAQFRCIEVACGGGTSASFAQLDLNADLEEAERWLRQHNVYEAALTYLWRQGRAIPDFYLEPGSARGFDRPVDPNLEKVIEDVYNAHQRGGAFFEAYLLLEGLVEFDELFSMWRYRHVKMVERTIGSKRGTGGSAGIKYLRTTLRYRFFPEIWTARSRLG